ncbi:MAG: right-handed parallel beta-helix repeat-containing protein [Planctomycetales bacterium]|nr:right-handed parallel beta-helix repeat-containing protein [Planctomycetales bacterium]
MEFAAESIEPCLFAAAMPRTFVACSLLLTFAIPAAAGEVYVNNLIGSDRADGRSATPEGKTTGPTRSIGRALERVRKADRLIIANTGQPYYEAISLCEGKHCGRDTRPFEIVGNGAILDGTLPVEPSAWNFRGNDVFRFQPGWLSSQMLYLDGKPAQRRQRLADGAWPQIDPLEWLLRDGRVYFRVEPTKIPEDYALRYAARQTGITLHHVRHVKITDLIVQGFALDGVNAHDGAAFCRLENVTSRGNGRSGVSVGGSSRLALAQCTIGDNGQVQLRTEGHSIALLSDTIVVDNTAPSHRVEGGELYFDGQRIQADDRLYPESANPPADE